MATPTVLIVDDEALLRWVLKHALIRAGYRVVEAASGREAIERSKLKIDLVLLDIGLPDADGVSLLPQLFQPENRGGQVIVMTSHGTAENRTRALTMGARHFLVKPFNEAEVLALIESLVPLSIPREPGSPGAVHPPQRGVTP